MTKLLKLCFACCLMLRATFLVAINPEDAYKALQEIENKIWGDGITQHEVRENFTQKFLEVIQYQSPSQDALKTILETFEDGFKEKEEEGIQKFRLNDGIIEAVSSYLEGFYKVEDFTPRSVVIPDPLDFSEATMLDVIPMFYAILQCKTAHRSLEDRKYMTADKGDIWNLKYITKKPFAYYPKSEDKKTQYCYTVTDGKKEIYNILDPYFTKIKVVKKEYHLHLDYAGVTNQPGNCCLRQSDEGALSWSDYKLEQEDHRVLRNLLLCLEVSRRHVEGDFVCCGLEEGEKSFMPLKPDTYKSLPILGAIVIGLELMKKGIIKKEDFFYTGKQCCCFSSISKDKNGKTISPEKQKKERETHIKNLLGKFLEYKDKYREGNIDLFSTKAKKLYKNFINLKVTDNPFSFLAKIKKQIEDKGYYIKDNFSFWDALLQQGVSEDYVEKLKKEKILNDALLNKLANYLQKKCQRNLIIVNSVLRSGPEIKISFHPNVFSCYSDEGCVKCDKFGDALTKAKTKKKEPVILLYEEYKSKHWSVIYKEN